ncbi:uncharacterized protein ACIB01_017986 [Guaruba guarouba]
MDELLAFKLESDSSLLAQGAGTMPGSRRSRIHGVWPHQPRASQPAAESHPPAHGNHEPMSCKLSFNFSGRQSPFRDGVRMRMQTGATGDSTATNPNEKQSPRANGIGSVPTTHIPARLEGALGGKRGNNEAKLCCVSKCQSSARCCWRGLAQLLCRGHAVWKPSALSAAGADACAHPARRQVTCIFHSLGFITSWNADLARRAMRGFASLRVYFRCRVFFCQMWTPRHGKSKAFTPGHWQSDE